MNKAILLIFTLLVVIGVLIAYFVIQSDELKDAAIVLLGLAMGEILGIVYSILDNDN